MPTVRGWAMLGAGLALTLLWYLLGDPELMLFGGFLVLATAIAVLYVRRHPPSVTISRRLGSTAVHNGETTTVALILSNVGRRAVRNLTVTDEVERLGLANFEIASLDPGEVATASYRVTCRPRGVYLVGPGRGVAADPLGLAELTAQPGPVDRLVVYPTVEGLAGLPVARGRDPALAASRPEHSQRGGEDFYTLREYQQGDDLRRIHWPSSAKTDELMIRQLETPWQSRALVFLDVRAESYESADAFETAVSGTASVVTHLARSGFDADLWAGDPDPIDASRYGAAMERLALVEPLSAIDLTAVAGRIRLKGGGGALVMLTGSADRHLLAVQRLLANDYSSTVLMSVESATSQTQAGFHRLGVTTVTVRPGENWTPAWNTTMRSSWDAVSVS